MASIIRADALQNTNTSNLITQTNATTITVGASGQTATVPSGASLAVDTIKNTNLTTLITQTNATTITIGTSGQTISIPSGVTFSPTLTNPVIAQINDANGNEEIKFTATNSAVNELTIANAATGTSPTISATGNDSNIDLFLTPKGIGLVTINGGGKIQHIAEKTTVSATAATGTIAYDVTTQAVLYYTSNASANWTLNIRGDSTNTLNSIMDIGESITVVFAVTNGSTPYYNNALQVDGSSVTAKWQGGTAPTSGNASSIDIYSYTVIKTASATFTVLASQTQFK